MLETSIPVKSSDSVACPTCRRRPAKGYEGTKMVTHGHGAEMESGFVGVMLEGVGTILIKSIKVSVLEDE